MNARDGSNLDESYRAFLVNHNRLSGTEGDVSEESTRGFSCKSRREYQVAAQPIATRESLQVTDC